MSRYSQSPSPGQDANEAPSRGKAADDGDRWIGRSRSGPRAAVRGRGSAYLADRSLSRSRSPLPEPHRRRRRADPRNDVDRQRSSRGPDGGRRRNDRRGGNREHDYRRMAEAQQAAMRNMMGGGMMGMNPMQMAMMQQQQQMAMMHPSYMAAMQKQQQKMKERRERRKARAKAGVEGSASDSSDSSSSSSDSSLDGGFNPAAAMAAMAAMQHQHHWPPGASVGSDFKPPGMGMGLPPTPVMAGDPDGHVEAYLKANPVSEEAADRLKCLPPHLQAAVMNRGKLDDRNASAILLARVRDAEVGRIDGHSGMAPAVAGAGANAAAEPPAKKSVKKDIEDMITNYRLEINVAWTMRALPPDKQKLAAKIDPSGHSDPSGYVAEELKKIV